MKKLVERFSSWKIDAKQTKMARTFEFEKQIDGLIFIARTTVNAEILKHYPEINFSHLKVKMTVKTLEDGGFCKNDISLLSRIEHIYEGQDVDKND